MRAEFRCLDPSILSDCSHRTKCLTLRLVSTGYARFVPTSLYCVPGCCSTFLVMVQRWISLELVLLFVKSVNLKEKLFHLAAQRVLSHFSIRYRDLDRTTRCVELTRIPRTSLEIERRPYTRFKVRLSLVLAVLNLFRCLND